MPYTAILHFHTRVRSQFRCLFGQISTFSTFFGIKLAPLSQSKASTSPFVPRAGFLEPCSCFFTTFHQAFLASLSTSARNQEKHQKKRKNEVFFPSAIFFTEKHFIGCRYIYGRTLLTCTNDSPSKEVYSKFSPTILHLSGTSGHRGCIFTTLFLHIQTRQKHAGGSISTVCRCTCCPPKTMPLGRLHEKWE